MRLFADENFPRPIVEVLRSEGHDVVWARTDCPGLKDRALLERADADGRVIFTLDKDFWQLALQRPIPLKRCGVILFRVHPAIPENLERLVHSAVRSEQRAFGGHAHRRGLPIGTFRLAMVKPKSARLLYTVNLPLGSTKKHGAPARAEQPCHAR